MSRFTLFALLVVGLFALLSPVSAAATKGFFKNNCGFTAYAKTAHGNGGDTGIVAVPPGQTYWAAYDAQCGGEGVVIKVDNNAALSHPYQVEYSCRDSRTWYDLSSLDGSPFVTNRRFVQVGDAGVCPTIFCTYNDKSCEWPVQKDCHNGGPLAFYLC